MKRKNFKRFINQKALLIAGLIALVFCLTFTSCGDIPLQEGKDDIKITGVTVAPKTVTIPLGDCALLTATVSPANATHKEVKWSTVNKTIISVNNGIVTTVKGTNQGATATVTVATAYGTAGFKDTCSVTVGAEPDGAQVTGVSFNENEKEITLSKGDTKKITAIVSPSNAKNPDVFYISDDPTVATVDGTGKITAVSEGVATITVYTKNKGMTAFCDVLVEASKKPVTSVSIPSTLALIPTGTETLIPTILPNDATNKDVTWSSSAPSIATVDASGKVTAVAVGNATITVTADGGRTATCTVTVAAAGVDVTGVKLSKNTLSMLKDKSELLIATVSPTNATSKEVSWASSDSAVASVTNGMVSALKAGTATITVTTSNGSKTDTCTVTVVDQSTYFGKYEGTYKSGTKDIKETIELSNERIYIYDNEGTGTSLEFIDFTVSKWETTTTPDAQKTAYPTAFKITGIITGAYKTDSGMLYGSSTADGFTQNDIDKGTVCWMNIYISNDGKIIRSPFSKNGKDNGTKPVATNKSLELRVYTKVPATP